MAKAVAQPVAKMNDKVISYSTRLRYEAL